MRERRGIADQSNHKTSLTELIEGGFENDSSAVCCVPSQKLNQEHAWDYHPSVDSNKSR